MLKKLALSAMIAVLPLAALNAAENQKTLNGAGASFPAPAYVAWAFAYEKKSLGKINYQSIGSGGGIKQVSERIVDFGASDEPLKADKLAEDKLLQFPTLVGSIVLAHNIKGVSDNKLRLKNEVLAEIYLGKITKWNDPKIVADNEGLKLPDATIEVIRRSDGSGTTFNFTTFLSLVSAEWKEKFGAGKAVDWATGAGAKGNEGIAALIAQTPNSIGYLENAYATKNKLARAALTSKSGKWVAPTNDNAKAAVAKAKWSKDDHFYQSLILQEGDSSYPLVAPTFILLPAEKADTNKEIVAFFKWAFQQDSLIAELGYIPLDSATKKLVIEYLQ
ncbi:MAG: phosphate ABC transporter substrate-binding protein PstS [Helicobacteraceae bacterium]|nr:phosphate ABC transporter substrate-binding protein PstS [Helicobacteraceae bacterium]